MYRVLLVDDEEYVLNALRRELLSKPDIGHDGLEIEAFTSPVRALERAREPEGYFDIAIVDYAMPAVDGVAFFTEFRKIQPDAARILLTAQAGVEGAIGAINQARVDGLVTKPWHEYDLKGRIALAIHQRELERENRRRADTLRSQPEFAEALTRRRETYRLMLVDDDEKVLRALERELSEGGAATAGHRPLFSIVSYAFPMEALYAAEKHAPDLVIADYSMPLMNGVMFFHRLRQLCPDTVRILLSGRADIGVLADAINIAGVYHFIGKPWEAAELKTAMAQALVYHDVLSETRLLAQLLEREGGGQEGMTRG